MNNITMPNFWKWLIKTFDCLIIWIALIEIAIALICVSILSHLWYFAKIVYFNCRRCRS